MVLANVLQERLEGYAQAVRRDAVLPGADKDLIIGFSFVQTGFAYTESRV